MSGFHYEKDADGIVTVTMDLTGPVNAMNAEYHQALGETVERLEKEPGLTGVVIASAKSTFFAGADLNLLLEIGPADAEALFTQTEQEKGYLRRLERLEVPVAAAINGAALGGGFEICLACNHRLVVNDPKALVGLPEVTLGLLPGAGGTVRMVHLLGLEKALPFLLEGTRRKPAQALAAGLVDEIVEKTEDLVPRARAWVRENPGAWQQPWDRKDHKIPGGTAHQPHILQLAQVASATVAKKTRGLLPALERILSVAVEATLLDFDTALRVETRNVVALILTREAKNLITTMFFQMNKVNGGAARPKEIPATKVRKLGVLGAGMMGQGIAYSAAMAGIPVVLRDISLEAAQKGKAYSEALLAKRDPAQRAAVLSLITPTAETDDLAGCDLIVEAVFESIPVKEAVIRETEPLLATPGTYGSNTSTLPISRLAQAAARPENFIGIHFFSPVDKMPLVEIICGEKTGDEALARAFDFARQIGKTPIVVNDSLGFFTSRVFGTYVDEGCRLLREGVLPVRIDNLGRQIGMPVGPLAVHDEVSQKLTLSVIETHRAMGLLGSRSDTSGTEEVAELLVKRHGRGGRAHGGGFYDYPAGAPKRMWPELARLFPKANTEMPDGDIKDRMLFRQVIESIKCLEEGVLRSVADGNVGSILGIGAPPWTGGFLQFVNTYGLQAFCRRTSELAEAYGDRFRPPALLLAKAEKGEKFA